MVSKTVARDDEYIEDLLNATEHLHMIVNDITEFFTDREENITTSNIVPNLCRMIEDLVNETLDIMMEKACVIEGNVAKIPSLSVFDDFMFKLCGGMCLEECHLGFPLFLLTKWHRCQSGDRGNVVIEASSEYVKVSSLRTEFFLLVQQNN